MYQNNGKRKRKKGVFIILFDRFPHTHFLTRPHFAPRPPAFLIPFVLPLLMPKTLDTPSHTKTLTPMEPSNGGLIRVKQQRGREQRRRGGWWAVFSSIAKRKEDEQYQASRQRWLAVADDEGLLDSGGLTRAGQ